MNKLKILIIIIALMFSASTYAVDKNAIYNQCIELGFKDKTPELAKCRLELLVLSKKTNLEEQQIKASQAQAEAAKANAIAAEAQTRATMAQTRAAEASARAQQSLAHDSNQRQSRELIERGQRMMSGACTLGVDC
jgi:hypothetical protein